MNIITKKKKPVDQRILKLRNCERFDREESFSAAYITWQNWTSYIIYYFPLICASLNLQHHEAERVKLSGKALPDVSSF